MLGNDDAVSVAFGIASSVGDRAEQQDAAIADKMAAGAYAVVCDGMGGHPGSRLCAFRAAAGVADYLKRAHLRPNRKHLASYVMGLPRAVQNELTALAADGNLNPQSATTLAAVLVQKGIVWLVTVGDCRCTVVRDGDVFETTVPHNALAVAMRDNTEPAPEDRRSLATSVTRCLGPLQQLVPERVAVTAVPIEPGDAILITSDGVHEVLSLPGMVEIVGAQFANGARVIAEALVDAAVRLASPRADNATVVVLIIGADS